MPRGRHSFFILVFSAAIASTGCGAIDDVSNSLKEIKKSNANMEKMQGLMEQSNQTAAALKQDSATSVRGITQSNTTSQAMDQKMQSMLEQSQAMLTQMTAMHQQSGDMLERMGQMLETSNGIRKDSNERMDRMTEITGNTLEAVKETRDETKKTRAVIEKEVPLKIHDFLTELSDFVRNKDKENTDRVTSAGIIYRTLADEKLGPVQFHKFVVEKFEMCDMRAATPSGDLCTDTFLDLPLHWGNTFRTESKPNLVQKTYRNVRELVLKWSTKNNKDDTLPVQPLRPNAVFALALNPEFINTFYGYMVAGAKDPVALDFVRFSRRFLKDSLYYMAYFLEKARGGISSAELVEFQRRQNLVLALQALPRVPAAPKEKDLATVVRMFLGAVADQPGQISDDDQKILDQIRASAGVDKVVARSQ